MLAAMERLRTRPELYREILPEIFKQIDPNQKNHTALLWLMAMPDILSMQAWQVFECVNQTLKDNISTLGQLAVHYSRGTMFEIVETGQTYQYVGHHSDGIAARSFESEFIEVLSVDTVINRIF